MFNIATMKTALFGQIGFIDSDDPTYEELASTLTASATGMFYNDYHPLVTIENLDAIAHNYDGFNYDAYVAATSYSIGDKVKQSGISWESLTDANQGNSPSADDGTNWKLPINDWLTQKVNASISKMLNRAFTNKKLTQSTKTLLENVQLFDGAGRFQDTITASGRFVALELTPKRINNIALKLDYLGFQFSQIQTDLTIYLFHSSQLTAINTQVVTTNAATSFDWIAGVDFNLPYVDYANNIDSGGKYYLGYFEDDITGSAIKKQNQHGFGTTGCKGCNDTDWYLYNMWNQFFDVRAIEVASGDLNGTSLWDLSKTGYQPSTNFGLNLSVSVKTDVTDMLVSNKDVFTDALGNQFASDMLGEIMSSSNARLNRPADNAQKMAILELQEVKTDEASDRLKEAIEGLMFDFSKLTQVLPKDTPRRIKITSV